jgi:RNA polymerase sigma-70 factor (ECF subfamily)
VGVLLQGAACLAALALFITGSPAAADDVVQETFVQALRARIKHTSGTVHGLLSTIAYRLALKEVKRVRGDVALEDVDIADNARDALEEMIEDERGRLVAEAIGALDAKHRETLILRFYGGYSYEEMAELLEIPLGTVKSRMFHAVKSCRQMLKQKGVFK